MTWKELPVEWQVEARRITKAELNDREREYFIQGEHPEDEKPYTYRLNSIAVTEQMDFRDWHIEQTDTGLVLRSEPL